MPTPRTGTPCEKCGRALDAGSRFCNLCGAPAPGAAPLEPEDVRPGDLLEGTWRIESTIGRGGMGTVYLATDVVLGRKVAVKMLKAELLDHETHVARFEREARAAAALEHPKVVLVYGVGRHHGRPFIVMKHLQGETLSKRLSRNRASGALMPLHEVRSIGLQVCAGLSHIHEHGLVHRDLKPSNIFVGPDLSATIIDFGILQDLNSTERLTRAGAVMGTPHYLSPEQVLGKACDHRLDLYSLGVILFELLTGRAPFDGTSAAQIFEKHVREPPPDPRQANPAVPPELGNLLRRLLAKDPERRPQSAKALAQELARAFALDESPDAGSPTAPDLAPLPSDRPTVLARPLPLLEDKTVPMDPQAALSEPATTSLRPLAAARFPQDTTAPMEPVAPTTTLVASAEVAEAIAQERGAEASPPEPSTTRMLWVGVAIGVATALALVGIVAVQLLADPPAPALAPAAVKARPLEPKKPRASASATPAAEEEEPEAPDEDSPGSSDAPGPAEPATR